MRITIGGALVVLGAAAVGAVVFVPAGTVPVLDKHLASAKQMVSTSLGLFHSASSSSTAENTPLTSQDLSQSTAAVPLSTEPVIPVAAVPVAPVPVAVVEEPKPAVVKKTSRRRRTKKKPVAKKKTVKAAPKAAVAPAAAVPKKAAGGSLVGSYVILTLNTGREVKGILQEQDAISYKVELPGLGEFSYPSQNVKSIRAAE